MESQSCRLDGKVALVTGAGRGIGRGIAIAMAKAGARVVVNDSGVDVGGGDGEGKHAARTVADIREAGGEAVAHTEGIHTSRGADDLVRRALDTWGQVDVVVNNAGILRDGLFHKMPIDDWRAVLDVHLNGSFYVARAAASHLREQRSGSYIFMTSTSGLVGSLGQSNYAAAKMGLAGLSRSIAIDMARFGVRSNCIAPWANTRMIDAIPTTTPAMAKTVARMRTVDAACVAPLAVFLASDAAHDVSGQILGARSNELYLFSQPRVSRSVHRSEGWSPESIATHMLPAFRSQLVPVETSEDVFCWDPI